MLCGPWAPETSGGREPSLLHWGGGRGASALGRGKLASLLLARLAGAHRAILFEHEVPYGNHTLCSLTHSFNSFTRYLLIFH